MLSEAPAADPNRSVVEKKRKTTASLDQQIDSIIMGFEKDSQAEDDLEAQVEAMSLVGSLLREAPGDEDDEKDDADKEDKPDDTAGDDDGGDDALANLFSDDIAPGQDEDDKEDKDGAAGDEDQTAPQLPPNATDNSQIDPAAQPQLPQKPPINTDKFAENVARLIDNYDSLLDIVPVLINRASNYVRKNYGEQVVDQMLEKLRINHGIDLETRDDEPERPIAQGAGPIQ